MLSLVSRGCRRDLKEKRDVLPGSGLVKTLFFFFALTAVLQDICMWAHLVVL